MECEMKFDKLVRLSVISNNPAIIKTNPQTIDINLKYFTVFLYTDKK